MNEWTASDIIEIIDILRDIRGVVSAKTQPRPECPGCRELGAAREDALRLRSERDAAMKERDELAKCRAAWLKDGHEQQTELNKANEEIQALRKRIGDMWVDGTVSEKTRLERELNETKEALRAANSGVCIWRGRCSRVEGELGEANAMKEQQRVQAQHLNAELSNCFIALNDLKTQLRDLDERCKRLTREREEARKSVAILNRHISPHVNWMLAVQSKARECKGKCELRWSVFDPLVDLIAKGPGPSPDPNTCTEGGERGE